jgi:hypothetical protein
MILQRSAVRRYRTFALFVILISVIVSASAWARDTREVTAELDAFSAEGNVGNLAAYGATGELSTTRARACFDTARHKAHYIRNNHGITLEVLDWGGSGTPMVFLTGLGNSAHIFDNFAYQFTDRFRVIGITRRGYGNSSKPSYGYDLETRVADNIMVLDHFNFQKAIFVGHSIAGVELSRLGAAYPERVSKLVYLDAYDYGELHD